MAVFLNNKVGVKIGAVDLSDHVTSVVINRSFDELNVTAMGDGGNRYIKGLESSSITIDFLNDTASGEVLQTLQSVWGTNATIMPKYSYVKNIGNDGSGTNEVVKTPELASNYINRFKPFKPKIKETLLSELYIQDAYAKRSKKRFTTIKNLIHDLISSIRNVLIRKI